MCDRLLAKSSPKNERPSESVYLKQHLTDVYQAALQILDFTANDQLQALGLSVEDWKERFENVVSISAALHDLGKANDHFQGILQHLPRRKNMFQGLRHEWCTLLMMQIPEIENWLRPAVKEENDWYTVQWAISGHHPAYHRSSPPRKVPDGCGSEIKLYIGHKDFHDCLHWIGDTFKLGTPPKLQDKPLCLVSSNNAFSQICKEFIKQNIEWEKLDDKDKRFVAVVKACLINADIAGSALPKDVPDESKRSVWIQKAFEHVPSQNDLSKIIAERLSNNTLRPFQKDVAEKAGRVTFVKAGCGTGKTLAAYNWALNNCPRKRLYVCYPTTGTATEGFRDYLVQPEVESNLFHSRRDIDFEIILGADGDNKEGNDDADESLARIQSLEAWSTPIVSCTVDTVLGITQNSRRGLYAWSALAGAAFVFDEIHSYDDQLFGALLRFLSTLRGVKVLLMTASLPEARLQSLSACLKRINEELVEIAGPTDIEELPRYHKKECTENHNLLPEIKSELVQNGKVLWVCNTVSRAMEAAQRAGEEGSDYTLYHSRFKYVDRVKQHKKVIDAFKNPDKPALAICTQVAEMSLDLSAMLLVTDLAPVPSLIQRLGRLNRRAKEGDQTRPFIVIEPVNDEGHLMNLPYTPEDLAAARRWLNELPHQDISQQHLANAWEQDAAKRRPAYVHSAWIDGGPATQVLELREVTPGIVVIRQEDKEEYEKTNHHVSISKMIQEISIPMTMPPRDLDWKSWDKKLKGVPIAPTGTIEYSAERGAAWQRK